MAEIEMNVSPYAYVASNPINYIDPFGLWKAGQNIPLVWISGEDNEMSGGGGGGAGYTYLPMIYGHSYGPFENGGGSFAFGGNPNIRVTGNGRGSGEQPNGGLELKSNNPKYQNYIIDVINHGLGGFYTASMNGNFVVLNQTNQTGDISNEQNEFYKLIKEATDPDLKRITIESLC